MPRDQEGEPSYAEKLGPADHHIDWNRPAFEVLRVVRVGRAWTTFRGKRFTVVAASRVDRAAGGAAATLLPGQLDGVEVVAGSGTRLRLVTVLPEGRRAMPGRLGPGSSAGPGERLGAGLTVVRRGSGAALVDRAPRRPGG